MVEIRYIRESLTRLETLCSVCCSSSCSYTLHSTSWLLWGVEQTPEFIAVYLAVDSAAAHLGELWTYLLPG